MQKWIKQFESFRFDTLWNKNLSVIHASTIIGLDKLQTTFYLLHK